MITKARSPRWNELKTTFILKNKFCAGCGSIENLNVHHIKPFHAYPSLELVENNLIILCENKNLNCHFVLGHFMNWRKINKGVIGDCKIWYNKLKSK
jgi:5-methylcytosine-specific restriction enzyme A